MKTTGASVLASGNPGASGSLPLVERRRDTRARRGRSALPFRELLEQLPTPILAVDCLGHRVFANAALNELVGCDAREPLHTSERPRYLATESYGAWGALQRAVVESPRTGAPASVEGDPWIVQRPDGDSVVFACRHYFQTTVDAAVEYVIVALRGDREPTDSGSESLGPALPRARMAELGRLLRTVAAELDILPGASGSQRDVEDPNGQTRALLPELERLSARELEILHFLRGGLRVASIGRVLDISSHTVRNHIQAIFRKVGVHSQTELLEILHRVDAPLGPVAQRG